MLLLGLLGLAVGLVGTLLGVGGGLIVIPVLLAFYGLSPGSAAGTSLVVVLINALSGTLAYLRQRRVDVGVGLAFSTGAIPGSMVGAFATMVVSSESFRMYFAIVLISTAIYIAFARRQGVSRGGPLRNGRRRRLVDHAGREYEYSVNPYLIALFSVLSGFVAGFFGIGGGVVHVPVMMLLFGVPAHIATATSHFILTFTAASGIAAHAALRHVDLFIGGAIASGALVGAQIGAKTSERFSSRALELLFAAFMIFIAINLLLQPSQN